MLCHSIFLNAFDKLVDQNVLPFFDIIHCLLSAVKVRDDLGPTARNFKENHPFACLVSTMLVIFAGGMFSNGFLGEPIVAVLLNSQIVTIAFIAWFLVFYCPFDIVYKLVSSLLVTILFSGINEIYRCKKIQGGVLQAAKFYPNAYILMILIGTINGNGYGFMKPFARLARGIWIPEDVEFMKPSFSTKSAVAASIIFVLEGNTHLMSASPCYLYTIIVLLFIYVKLYSILVRDLDPFKYFENSFSFFISPSGSKKTSDPQDGNRKTVNRANKKVKQKVK